MNTHRKGFTLIELLVVVAIIALLSAVVIAALNNSRAKGTDASIKQTLTNLRPEMELWYYNNANTYGDTYTATIGGSLCPNPNSSPAITPPSTYLNGIFLNSNIVKMIMSATKQSNTNRCASSAGAWAVAVELKTGKPGVVDTIPDAWCVDSLSKGKTYTYANTTEGIWSAINASNVCK